VTRALADADAFAGRILAEWRVDQPRPQLPTVGASGLRSSSQYRRMALGVLNELHAWLTDRLGRDGYAIHPDSWAGYLDVSAVHLDETGAVPEVVAWLEARLPAVQRHPLAGG